MSPTDIHSLRHLLSRSSAHPWVSSTLGPRPAPHPVCGYRSAASLLDLGDVLHLHARHTLSLSHLVGYSEVTLSGYSVTVLESPVLAVCYVRGAHKQVYSANIRGDKPVACLGVEPLEDSLGHMPKPTFPSLGSSATKAASFVERLSRSACAARFDSACIISYILYHILQNRSPSSSLGPRPLLPLWLLPNAVAATER